METYTVERTGDRPLAFEGEELASASSYTHDGATNARWHELALYRTAAGRYVVAIGFRTRWQGERNHDTAIVADTAEGAVEMLRTTSPTEHLLGFPGGAQYEAKQARIARVITAGYDTAVSEVVVALGPERIE